MTTEKKKRMPKPAMTTEVRTVIASIPFLNFTWKDQHRIANEEALLEVFRQVVQAVIPTLDTPESIKDATRWADESEPMRHVRETQIISSSMVRDLVTGRASKMPPPEWLSDAQDSLDSLRVRILNSPIGLVIDPKIEEKDKHTWRLIAKRTRTLLIKDILTSFIPGGAGLEYIGACPRCGKIFEKKRGDKVFCSPACLSASMQKRYDEKQRRKKTSS
ncbi:hypothetical protein KBA41_01700 [Candidatus Ozemobacteraceae bacterium]|nr:hypothetical protein [Candidatus Ozemobacteraceae bacterium]